jgi:hypothetical protein
MGVSIGASSIMGVALEATLNTYTAPTKYIPFLSETMTRSDDQQWRRPVRASADAIGVVGGHVNTSGDITIEAEEDQVVYFLRCARTNFASTGTTNKVYTFTPSQAAVPAKTMSITIVRNGVVFGYYGCITSQFVFSVDSSGIMQATFSMIGLEEGTQSAPTATWPTTTPFGAGMYSVQVPTATQVFDADQFTFTVNDNGTPQFRLNNTTRAAQYVAFGERDVTLTIDRDFVDKTQYADFVALTSQSVTVVASKGANNAITINIPVGTQTEYPVNVGNQGDVIRASTNFTGSIDNTGNSYTVTVATQEVIT